MIKADQDQYVPGGLVKLTITTQDHKGRGVPSLVGLTISDDTVHELLETREQLPVMVLLEDEVVDLADAHVYLDANNKDAPRAVDLLLGVQGWRQFT